MSLVLLDTTVGSLLHPGRLRDARRALYEPVVRNHTPAISFQTVAELLEWAEQRHWNAAARRNLDALIRGFVVIYCDYQLACTWARLMVATERSNRRFSESDAWIAATAVYRQIPLFTHDRHFLNREDLGLHVISF